MWGAIKNDLFEFVNTVQTDTASSIAKVIQDDDDENSEEEEPPSAVEKAIQELNQSFTTFSEGVTSAHEKDFKKFMKKFSLSSNGSDIARILEWEDDVSKYYADLVPNKISADLFWGRYFFKRHIIETRGPDHGLDDDDEEELAWDEGGDKEGGEEGEGGGEEVSAAADDLAGVIEESTPSKQSTNRVDCVEGLGKVALKTETSALSGSPSHAPSTELVEENMQLKQRVVELEQEVQQLRRALTEAQSMKSTPAVPVASSSEVSFVDIATDTDKEDDKQYIQCSNSPQETSSGSDRPVLIDEDSDFPNNSQSNVVARKKHTASESTAEPTSTNLEVSADAIPSSKGSKEPTKESTPSSLPSASHAAPPTSEGEGASASAVGALPDLDEDEEGGWDSTW